MKGNKQVKKGFIYWLCVGWWWEFLKLYWKIFYWVCIGWWWKPFKAITRQIKINILNRNLDRINTNLDNLETEIDSMLNSSIDYQNYDTMEGHQFEYFCADILKKNGFSNVEVTQGSGDHGIDVLAEKDNITYAVQCKCYSSNIGNAAVQQAHTGKSLYHKDIAVVLTNRYFTAQAKDEAAQLGVKLWDRDKLNEMINNAR